MLTEPKSLKYFELSEASGGRHDRGGVSRDIYGSQARAGAELLAVEEPLELQLAYGPPNARRVKSISVTMRFSDSKTTVSENRDGALNEARRSTRGIPTI